MLRSIILCVALCFTVPLVSQANAPKVVILGDGSGSMGGEKELSLKEGIKLGIALLDEPVKIIAFAQTIQFSQVFLTKTTQEKRTAMASVDRLRAGGGTNYLAALTELNKSPKGTVAIFVSDGANTQGTDADVMALVKNAPGPIYTVGVDAGLKAQNLLNQMASKTGGASVSISQAEDLTKTLVMIAQRLGNYRSYKPHERVLKFPGTHGHVIAFCYDGTPKINATPNNLSNVFEHQAKLAEHVNLIRFTVNGKTNLIITAEQPRTTLARLAEILRNDLARSKFTINAKDGKVKAGESVDAMTKFETPQGIPIDPSKEKNKYDVEYLVKTAEGKVLSRTRGQLDPQQKALTASVPIPKSEAPVTIVQKSGDTVDGRKYVDEKAITVFPTKVKFRGLVTRNPKTVKDLGKHFANGGLVSLGEIEIRSHDTAKVEYAVEVNDLASNSGALPTIVTPDAITPTRDKPVTLKIQTTIGNVSTGVYRGQIKLVPVKEFVQQTLEQDIQIAIDEPLKPEAVDFGKAGPDQYPTTNLIIDNKGDAFSNLKLKAMPFKGKGGKLTLVLPKTVSLKEKGKTKIPLSLYIDKKFSSQGIFQTTLLLARSDSAVLQIPVRVIVGLGWGGVIVAPKQIEVTATSQSYTKITMLVKANLTANLPDDFSINVGVFKNGKGEKASVLVEVGEMKNSTLSRTKPIQVEVFIVFPKDSGTYHGELMLTTKKSGTQRVPVKIIVP